ncbi:efflux RND transporter permease subunit [Marichromatium gracile]|uniref:Cobalt-zinc-cadmium resistance protein CzcA n=1 Tax=Marichromatium gracile TaxID=1048 RepID=A0A4R4AM73_MARGR|nr:CusA/CzcA family heavy metal efflux RND transporter [Marichromatium gracile]MBK1707595.1 CusA/CzcA family heavy metal efflux RND transporter [Marichromatium gracile]TCW39946.1 cobalt-zinc-cadmium resistance protein CzcA [Marichromatium gracile]
MLARLIQFALTQRLLMLLAMLALIGGGWQAIQQTPIDAFPDVSTTQVKIIVKAPGMTPEEVAERITSRIEVELLGIPDQTMLRSVAKYGLTDITIDFAEGTDIYWARQQVAERLNGVWDDLPSGLSGGIAPMTTPLGEMFMFSIEGGDLSLAERRDLLDWTIRPALRSVPGVAEVNALGGYVTTFEVVPDNARMAARGIQLADLRAALERNNRNDGAGRLDEGEETLLVRSEGAIQTLADLAAVVVVADAREPVRMADVAEVRRSALTRYGAVTRNGAGETVEGLVLGLRGANARTLIEGVQAKLDALAPGLPDGVRVEVFYDRGKLVGRAVHTVSKALIEATILVVVLLVLFLGDLRAALTVALVLPLAALGTFILMRQFGLSANLMSLGGLAIAIGMLVDAAVVVVENVVTQLARGGGGGRLPRLHLIYRAVREVSVPVASGILIIIIVFLPLLTLQGLEGKLFVPVALTIVFALASSLLLALTVIPVLSSFLLGAGAHRDPWLPRQLARLYGPLLDWALSHARVVVGAALALLLAAGAVYTQVGKSFMPTLDEGDLIVQLEKLPSITLDESIAIDQRVQRAILDQVPEVRAIVARTGSDELGLDPMGLNQTDSFLVLAPREEWRFATKDALVDAIRAVLDGFPGLGYAFTQPIEMRVSEMLTGVRGDLAVKIFGTDQDGLNAAAEAVVGVLESLPGAEDVYTPRNEGAQYLNLEIDRLEAGRLGIDADALASLLRAQIEGLRVGTIYRDARRLPLMIRGPESARSAPTRLAALQISLPDGRAVPLTNLVRVERVEGPVAISRERGNQLAVAIANVSGRDLVGFVEEARAAVAERVDLPDGYWLEWGGEFENQQRAAARLALVVPVALGLIFLVLFSTFGSVRQALLVLSNVPFALIGGVFALALTGEYLSVPASVGFIALLGIAVLNGVVMVTYFNQLRTLGHPLGQVVVEGAQRRLRPVLMTASIAAFGLVPLLFATGPGSEIQRPLAIVVVGGLVSATALTLILLPILYRRFGAPPTPGTPTDARSEA